MIKRLVSSSLWLVLIFGAAFTAYTEALKTRLYQPPDGGPAVAYVTDRLIVKFAAGVQAAEAAAIAQGAGARIAAQGYGKAFHLLAVPEGQEWHVMEALSRNPQVLYAHPDWIAYGDAVPNDPYYSPYQWNLDNSVYGGIEMEQAWDINYGGASSVIVAVVDTGIAYTNMTGYCQAPDLAGTSFVHGYDFINNDPYANDDESHGTHVAGTIAQTTDNGIGVAGVAFNSTLMPVKVLSQDGSGPISAIASGIRFAADNGADVINMSLGTTAPKVFLSTLQDAVKYADSKGVLQVAATGNAGATKIDCPACYAEVIAVSATTYNEQIAYYSNTGTGTELSAPGGTDREDLNSDGYPDMILQNTFNPDTKDPCDFAYWFFAGTSMSTPHVSGVAALLFAQGASGKDQVRQILRDTAKDLGSAGYDTTFGYGRVNAAAALAALVPKAHDVAVTDITAPASVTQGDLVAVSVSVTNQGASAETFDVQLRDSTDGVTIGTTSASLASGAAATVLFSWDTSASSTGDHTLVGEAVLSTDENPADNARSTVVTINAPVSGATAHVGDLDAAKSIRGKNWQVSVTVTVHDEAHNPVSNATVSGTWSGAISGSVSGTTASNGAVTFTTGNMKSGTSVTFTVDNLTHATLTYDATANHDPDGDSNGTSITVNK